MQALRHTLAKNVHKGNTFAKGSEKFSVDQIPDLSVKVAVITGGSEGIGYECSHTLLSKNVSKLFILSPSEEIIDGTLSAIREDLGGNVVERVQWMQCDLTD